MIRQFTLEDWPSGLEQDAILLSLDPDEIARRSGVRFDAGVDALDVFEAAVVDLGNGKSFALQYYPNAPISGTTLILRPHSARGLKDAMSLLDVRRHEVIWVAPHLKTHLWVALRERIRKGFIGSRRTVPPKLYARPRSIRRSGGQKPARLRA
ncbi:MAG: hypothetical protein AVDCRST_MAG91-1473 [uncultured Sphingomonadaceae bacterium]|uniref:Uncharacterized protein n=1 Tax=uncultured Sphingomonadaceae bacterium TaxID=169976 RepID=A0A6J4SXY9_9SPHN|nr:MAG: hypothetical protein AVDCRST_MAG91-1473 [uncultured Sphingomonadaceae bacterium]